MDPQDLYASPKPYTRTTIDDKTGLLTTPATSPDTTPLLLGPSGGVGVTNAFDGAEVTAGASGKRVFPRTVTVTTAAHAASYKTGAGFPLVVTGTINGVAGQTESLLLTQTNGNETVRGTKFWDDPTAVTISVPVQNDALGAFTAGVGDIGGPSAKALRGFKAHASGTVRVKGQDGKIDDAVMAAGAVEPTGFSSIVAVGTSAIGITVYA
jgi:hypothetical protein